MIRCYSRSSDPLMAISLYKEMLLPHGFELPNQHTYPSLLRSCSRASPDQQQLLGRLIHAHVLKHGFDLDVFVVSALIAMYSKCRDFESARQAFDKSPNKNAVSWASLIAAYCSSGRVEEARRLFDDMPEKNDSAWSSMISGYLHNGCYNDAVDLFREMKHADDRVMPNRSLLVSALSACASIGAMEEGSWIHSYIEENKLGYGLEIGTALVDFYTKCGCIEKASEVFLKMPRKDVLAWSAMINGFAVHGRSKHAFQLFDDMENTGIRANYVTFIGLLSACNHGGLVREGWRYFDVMRTKYHIQPTTEHYGCMVDLLSRAGKIEEAENLISTMPMKPDGVIWGALLNGCLIHGYVEAGERVGKLLIELDGGNSGRYVHLANLLAAVGGWDGARSVRKKLRERGVGIVPGCSFIEIDGVVERFLVDDKTHPKMDEIYKLIYVLNKQLAYSRDEGLLLCKF